MAQITLGALTTLNLSTHLDPMFTEVYDAFVFRGSGAASVNGKLYLSGQAALPSAGTVGTAFAPFSSDLAQLQFRGSSTSATGAVIFYNPNGQIGSISLAGSATAYNTSSDERLKENVVDAGDTGSLIDAMQVRSFDWRATGEHVEHGFVAQELHAVAPEAVTVGGDDETVEPWAIDQSKLIPILVGELQRLRARVAALEAA